MPQFIQLNSPAVVLAENDIDTDQIIPARFLKVTDKNGLGDNLFADWRYLPDGSPRPDFPLNQPGASQAQVLFSGHNFGGGSSREHAPWALAGFGFRAVIASSFADIFRNNALKNGLLPVQLEPGAHQRLKEQLAAQPDLMLTIDLESQSVTSSSGERWTFPIDAFSKSCLLKGVDELGYLLSFSDKIAVYEAQS